MVAAFLCAVGVLIFTLHAVRSAVETAFQASKDSQVMQGIVTLDAKNLQRIAPRLDPANQEKWKAKAGPLPAQPQRTPEGSPSGIQP